MNQKHEIGVGIFFLLLSVFYIAQSLSIQSFDPFGNSFITSQAMPQVIGGLVFVISIAHIIIAFVKLQKEKAKQTESSAEDQSSSQVGKAAGMKLRLTKPVLLMLITILLTCAYIYCFTRLGFILSSVFFLMIQIFVLIPAEKRKKWAAFIVCFSITIPVGLYLLFTRVLSMFLPRGLFGL
ncbi:MAG: tripartite tricarboxylate transporter TctB family protein [Treponema sp.]|nr:tripartite tricarboxylate transporter TctB family protein [Treponema sp.]